jgi:outer membrane assembly lipoprotein YfiO
MMRRLLATAITACFLYAAPVNTHGQTSAQISSTTPDRMLFAQAMNSMEHSNYSEARSQLKTLITNFDTSRYVPRAKLTIADAWFAEGNIKRAKLEYEDFITFFPNRPEVAQARTRVDWIERALNSAR